MITLSILQKLAVWILPVLFAITLHEAAHAFIANMFGDSTAKMLGRMTLNPLKHIDLVGTIVVPLAIAVLTQFQFIFGWAKPVPINWSHLRNPRRDMAIVAAAGPLANVLMLVLWAIVYKSTMALATTQSNITLFLLLTSQAGILINLVLALFNLIPLPPLDGSRIVASMLSPHASATYMRVEPYGFMIILLLAVSGLLAKILYPIYFYFLNLVITTINL
jgi:Zn-dependent protease